VGQAETGAISGIITDSGNAVVPAAVVNGGFYDHWIDAQHDHSLG
jgi:hypothetical protein